MNNTVDISQAKIGELDIEFDLHQVKNGDLLHVPPSALLAMDGGNVRRKRDGNLVESIKAQGIIQPVVARLMPDFTLQLLAGYGRRDGAIEAGLKTVPTIVRIVDDATALEIHFRENYDRTALSFASQIDFARRFMSFHRDAHSAASALNMALPTFRERLSLITCSENVLLALDDGAISVKHAVVLAAFDLKIQDNTLKKLLAEKWSVAELKQRADAVQIPLSKAIFDLTECNTCINNTAQQSGLFGMEDGAKCSKSSCFKEKSQTALEAKKAEAEEKFGQVLWLSQSLPVDRQTVAASVVGEHQFNGGCLPCTDRVAVMDDSILGGSCGSVLESQCTNKQCLSDCIKAFELSKVPAVCETSDVKIADVKTDGKAESVEAKEKKAKAANDEQPAHVGAVSSVVVEKHQQEALIASRAHLVGNETFKLVIHLMGLMSFTGFKAVTSVPNAMATLMKEQPEKLQRMIKEVEDFAVTKATSFQSTTPAHLAMTASAMSTVDGERALVGAWLPSESTLSSYTTAGLTSICILSGLDKHVEAKEVGGFKKMTAGRKGDVIKAILAQSDFDWTHFAPPAYLDLLGKAKAKPVAKAA